MSNPLTALIISEITDSTWTLAVLIHWHKPAATPTSKQHMGLCDRSLQPRTSSRPTLEGRQHDPVSCIISSEEIGTAACTKTAHVRPRIRTCIAVLDWLHRDPSGRVRVHECSLARRQRVAGVESGGWLSGGLRMMRLRRKRRIHGHQSYCIT